MEDKKHTSSASTPESAPASAPVVTPEPATPRTDGTEAVVTAAAAAIEQSGTSSATTASEVSGANTPASAPATPATEPVSTPVVAETTTPVSTPATPAPAETPGATAGVWKGYAIAAFIIAIMGIGTWYVLERDGRVTTSIFTGMVDGIRNTDAAPALRVNDVEITNARLQIAINQITQNAQQQGADLADPEVQTLIREQAVDMMVNTELLLQAAAADGITVTEEQIDTRVGEIETQVGGPEQLAVELANATITMEQLRDDIRTEITVQELLTGVVAAETITVTDEEVAALYEQAGGEAAGNPPLADIREQVAAQVQSQKEQEVVQNYLQSLRINAVIEEL